MDKLYSLLLEIVNTGNGIGLLIFIVASILLNLRKIFEFIDSRKLIKIQSIQEALNNAHIDGATKKHLERMIETEYFKRATGIYLEKEFRESLLESHQATNGELKFKHFKRAIPYLRYKDNKLTVGITFSSFIGFLYNSIFGFSALVSAVIIFIFPFLMTPPSPELMLTNFALSALTFITGLWMLSEAGSAYSARMVQKQVDRQLRQSEKKTQSKIGLQDRQTTAEDRAEMETAF